MFVERIKKFGERMSLGHTGIQQTVVLTLKVRMAEVLVLLTEEG
jgi:hypothetical protein